MKLLEHALSQRLHLHMTAKTELAIVGSVNLLSILETKKEPAAACLKCLIEMFE